MVDIYSPTGKELEILQFLEEELERRGIPCSRIEVEEDRYDILVAKSNEEIPLLFTGHIDTVPAYNLTNFGFREQGANVHGLGTSDMKSGCAAMIEAFTAFAETKGRLPKAALALVVGEEESGDGTEALIQHNIRAPWAIVAEPTSLAAAFGHFSYMEIELLASGKRAHASLARSDKNAVHTMLRALMRVTDFLEANYPQGIYNIRDVHSAEGGFAVPDNCSASIDLHLPPNEPQGGVLIAVEEIVARANSSKTNALSCRFPTVHSGYELPARGAVPALLRQSYQALGIKWKTAPFKSHSDANLLWAAGIKPLVLGPGQLSKAHTERESVAFSQVAKAATIYYQLLCRIG
jgi:acetylornithine deacetylase